jgi:cyanophycinase-like exopeptidase
MIGPLFLYSTSPAPHEATIVDRARQHQADRAGPLNAVVLQTAMATPSDADLASLRQHFCTQGVDVNLHDSGVAGRDDAQDSTLAGQIAAADLVLITGGSPALLDDRMAGTAALSALRSASEGGAVIAGCSAGAIVFGAGLPQRTDATVHGRPLWGWLPRTLIAPHFGNYDLEPWLTSFPGCTVLGIPDGGMALVTDGRDVRPVDRRPLTILPPGSPEGRVLGPGDRLTLPT